MRTKRVAAVAIGGLASCVWLVGLGACSLRDLSGYSSGDVPPPDDEGGEARSEAGSDTESGSDGAKLDAPITDAPAGSGFRCSDHPKAILCTTFDEPVFGAGFTPQGEGTLEASTTFFDTPPRALKASLPRRMGSAPKAFLERMLSSPGEQLRSFAMGWDVRVESEDEQRGVDLCGFFRSDPYYTLTIRLRRDPATRLELLEVGNAASAAGSSIEFTPLTGSLRADGFTRIELRVTYEPNGTSSSAAVFIDGKPAGSAPLIAHRYTGTPFVAAGIESSDGSGGAISVYVDNLLVEGP